MTVDLPIVRRLGCEENEYPSRLKSVLGKKAPRHIYTIGNLSLLNDLSIGFCGSRRVSDKGLETARDCADQTATESMVAVSGNAAGVDHEVHFHSLKSGGKTIFVLPEGIDHFRIKKTLENVWDWNRVLVISQFEPNEPWKSYRAMDRNKIIIALSQAMIVIEAGDTGGTLNAGLETIKLGLPLYVAEYQDMTSDAKGNKILLDMGAKRLAKSKTTNRASLKRIFDEIPFSEIVKSDPAQFALL